MATPEGRASQVVALRASAWGSRMFRNNSGVLPSQTGRPVRFGLGNESKKINEKMKTSDFIGWSHVVITPAMVGKTLAVFTALEAKPIGFIPKNEYRDGSREKAQDHFIQLVIEAGGIAGFCWDEHSVDELVRKFYEKATSC